MIFITTNLFGGNYVNYGITFVSFTMKTTMRKFTLLLGTLVFVAALVAQPSREMPKKTTPPPTLPTNPAGSNTGAGAVRTRQNTPRTPQETNPPVRQPRPVPGPVYRPVPIYGAPPVIINNGDMGSSEIPQPNIDPAVKQRAMIAAGKDYVRDVLKTMNPEVQIFTLKDASRGGTIKGAKGFSVEFPPMAFIDEEGNPVLGEVDITLTEYNDYNDFAGAGLTTQTTDGQILETGGMINLEAKSGTHKLKLASGKEVTIRVPELKDQKGFQTFYGVRTENNTQWSLNPQDAASSDTAAAPTEFSIRMLPVRMAAGGKDANLQLWKNYQALHDFVNSRLVVKPAVREKIMKAGIPFVYTIKINSLGKITEVKPKNREVGQKTLISSLDNQIESILKDAPAVDVSELPTESTKTFDIMFATVGMKNGQVMSFRPAVVSEAPVNENAVNNNPDEKNVKEFAMKSSSMGMINCDRFTGDRSKDTLSYHFERADAVVYILIKDMRSMVQPTGTTGEYRMVGIPANREIRSVAVIYDDQGNVNIGIADGVSGNTKVEFTQKMPFNAENLKAALNP